jgi:hypothetical protein
MSLPTAEELRALSKEDDTRTPTEIAEDWLYWFEKRGERFLTTAAKFGYSSVTLLLPFRIARQLDIPLYKSLVKEVESKVPGYKVSVIEEDYEGSIVYGLELSW